MELKQHTKAVQKLVAALKKITGARALSDADLLVQLKAALSAARALSLEDLQEQLHVHYQEAQDRADEVLRERREALLLAAKEANLPYKRLGDHDCVGIFKISYRGRRVRMELGSETYTEVEGGDGHEICQMILQGRRALEAEPLDRQAFLRQIRQACRLAREQDQSRDGWSPVRVLHAYMVLLRHADREEFLRAPGVKAFRPYSSAQFAFDLARFGLEGWGLDGHILRTRTPNMATVASGQAMTLPNLESIEVPGPQLAVLRVEKEE